MGIRIWIIASFLLALTGCQSGSEVPVGSHSVSLIVAEAGFLPRTLTVPAGETIAITVENKSKTEVTLSLLGRVLTPPVDEQDNILWSLMANAGDTSTFFVESPQAAGEYDLVISGLAATGTPEWVVAFVVTRP